MTHTSEPEEGPHGLVAELLTPDALLRGVQRVRAAGYTRFDAYTPFPIHGLDEAIGQRRTILPWLTFTAGVLGGLGGFALQVWTSAIDYPINIGGKPFVSWPAFIPVTFECTVMAAALTTVIGMFALNRLPRYYHPIFNTPNFERASTDRFFLCIEADDPLFDAQTTGDFLKELEPHAVSLVDR